MDATDSELVERAVAREAAAFAELIQRHRAPLLAMVRRLVADEHLRQDVLQETLVAAWQGLASLRDPARLRPWLIAIARNRCRDLLKSASRREQASSIDELDMYMARLGRMVQPSAEDSDIADLMRRLGDVQQPAARMFYIDGMSIREIAQRLCLSEGTVKSRLFHARRALRRRMNTDRHEEQ